MQPLFSFGAKLLHAAALQKLLFGFPLALFEDLIAVLQLRLHPWATPLQGRLGLSSASSSTTWRTHKYSLREWMRHISSGTKSRSGKGTNSTTIFGSYQQSSSHGALLQFLHPSLTPCRPSCSSSSILHNWTKVKKSNWQAIINFRPLQLS